MKLLWLNTQTYDVKRTAFGHFQKFQPTKFFIHFFFGPFELQFRPIVNSVFATLTTVNDLYMTSVPSNYFKHSHFLVTYNLEYMAGYSILLLSDANILAPFQQRLNT